jgi:L-threonylcarbamoyladenylate synthase
VLTKNIELASKALKKEGIIGFPTETVYGLAGNAFSEKAIKSIFELKKRPFNNPLIVHISSMLQLHEVAIEIPEKAFLLAKHFWPGPLTFILKKHPQIPLLVTANQATVAVRMPNHPLALKLLDQLNLPNGCERQVLVCLEPTREMVSWCMKELFWVLFVILLEELKTKSKHTWKVI